MRSVTQTVVITVLFVFTVLNAFSQGNRPGVIRVKIRSEVASQINSGRLASHQFGISSVDEVSEQIGVTGVRRLFRPAGVYEKAHQKFGLHLWYEISFKEQISVSSALAAYKNLSVFEVVEPCREYRLIEPQQQVNPSVTPQALTGPTNDPSFGLQWHYSNTGQSGGTPGADISLPQAWSVQTGNPDVVVAVIDGGIDINHPDLRASLWINTDEVPGNNIDDDLNGYVDDVNGYGFGDNTGTIFPHYHGTHVAGTIGAVTNNNIGVAGIAGGSATGNGARLMSCAGFGSFGVGGFEDAMVYAADNGAVISQNSWGGGGTAIEAAIDYFIARAGLDNRDANFDNNIQIGPMAGGIVIFAAGNSSTTDPSIGYPASYSPVMAVASMDHNDQKSGFSNYGTWVDIAAPGSDVYSTYPVDLGSYAYLSGTSMACPHVSGVAALIISQFKAQGYSPELVWDRLQFTADNVDSRNPNYVGMLGSGRLNAYQALQTPDDIPPAAITTLEIAQAKLTSMVLRWVATGSSGQEGAASQYELRYSTQPINSGNFNSATLITGLSRPKNSGSLEEFEASGLQHSTRYYFALKARDFFGNVSTISNVVNASTLQPPVIVVTPTSLTENLLSGQTSTRQLSIRNTGASDLLLKISSSSSLLSGRKRSAMLKAMPPVEYKGPRSTLPYKTILDVDAEKDNSQVKSSSPKPQSTGRLFSLNFSTGQIVELDTDDGSIISGFSAPESFSGGPEGLAFDGSYIYFVNNFGTRTIYKIDPTSGVVESTLQLSQVQNIDALASSGKLLYALDYNLGVIYEIDFEEGEVLRTIDPTVYIIGGMSFGGSRSTLFVSNGQSAIYELDIETGSVVNSFSPTGTIYGLGYSAAAGVLFAANVSYGRLDIYDPDTGQLLRTISSVNTSALTSDEAGGAWLKPDESVSVVHAGETVNVPVLFDATGLYGGTYHGDIKIKSNDPVTPLVTIPATLHVTGAPNLVVNYESFAFGDVYVGGQREAAFSIENNGTDLLTVTSLTIGNSNYTISNNNAPFSLNPGETREFSVIFRPVTPGTFNTTLSILSNDADQGNLSIPVTGRGLFNPLAVTPSSLSEALLSGQQVTRQITIRNTGSSSLMWNARTTGLGFSSLEAQLNSLNTNYQNITSSIPSRYDFYEGESNYYISDGGNDMYDGGNYLTTNLASQYINYTNGVITQGTQFGLEGAYFTVKYPGLFVLVADASIESFTIEGNLGADGSGNVDAAVLQVTRGGRSFKGFVKRVYNAWDPSVNHLIIVEDRGQSSHEYSSSTDSDFHRVNGLGSVNRIYYLLFAGSNGTYIDNAAIQTIMNTFLASVNEGVSWLTLSKTTGTLTSNSSESVNVTFDATGLDGGTHTASILVNDNTPEKEPVVVPVTLDVTGTPDIELPQTSLEFNDVYIGNATSRILTINNRGNDALTINATSTNLQFTLNASAFTILPRQSVDVEVTFVPVQPGVQTGKILIQCNDPDESNAEVSLSGIGKTPPLAEFLPDTIYSQLIMGDREKVILKIRNIGGDDMMWSIADTWATPSWLSLSSTSGMLSPNSETAIITTIDALNLFMGEYSYTLRVNYNGPNSSAIVPVIVSVSYNHTPIVVDTPDDRTLPLNDPGIWINLAEYFLDEDGEPLSYYVEANEEMLNTSILGSSLKIVPLAVGEAQVNIWAVDALGERADTDFNVVITNITDVEREMLVYRFHNYPNPFSGKTTIGYTLKSKGHVRLIVEDITGKEVDTILDEEQVAGDKVVEYDNPSLGNGMFICRMLINGKPAGVLKMIKY
ncbi:MAG TPA: S8 family serine peptidase [Ohtaekwangia sp.]